MTDLDDLIARLRDGKRTWGDRWAAADALEALRDEVARLRAALNRLADEADVDSYADCRDAIAQARAALKHQ